MSASLLLSGLFLEPAVPFSKESQMADEEDVLVLTLKAHGECGKLSLLVLNTMTL